MSAATKTVPALPPDVKEQAGQGAAPMVTVPQQAAEDAGLMSRVLVDPRVHDDCVTWTRADTARKGIALDEATRMADLLHWAACALKRDSAEGSGAGRPGPVAFTVERVPRATTGREAEKVTLTATAGRSPRGAVTITIGPAPAAGPGLGGAR